MELEKAKILATDLKASMESLPGISYVFPGGSLRREKPIVRDLDFIIMGDLSALKTLGFNGGNKIANGEWKGMLVQAYLCPDVESFAALQMFITGPAMWNIITRKKAIKLGMKLNQYGLWYPYMGYDYRILTPTEESIFEKLGYKYKTPQERNKYNR